MNITVYPDNRRLSQGRQRANKEVSNLPSKGDRLKPLIEIWERFNLAAFIVLAAIFAGLTAGGADEPTRAALFSAMLMALAIVTVLLAPSGALRSFAREHWLTGIAAVGFIGWTLFTAMPLPDGLVGLAHPIWAESGSPIRSISIAPASTLDGLSAWLAAIAAFMLGALISPTRESRDWTGRWLSIWTLVFALLALRQFFQHGANAVPRLDANQVSPNAAAAVFGALSIAAAAMVLRAGAGRLGATSRLPLPPSLAWASGLLLAPMSAAAMLFALACALLTASRGGLAATIAGFAALAILLAAKGARSRNSIQAAPLLGVLMVAAWVLWRGSAPTLDRLSGTFTAGRQQLLEPLWEAFLQRPLLGNGLNTYHQLSSMAATPQNAADLFYAGAAHNIYIQALAEAGVIGTSLCALMLGPPIARALWRALFGNTGRQWSAAVFAISVIFLLQGIADFTLQIPAVGALYGFMLGSFSTRPR